jgi:hypothetical protein
LFKAGVEPKWEDPECANGGKWTVISSRKPNLDTMWLETVSFCSFIFWRFFRNLIWYLLFFCIWPRVPFKGICLTNFVIMQCMALIGEQFDESQEICGVVASVRQRQDKLSLWTKTASNEAVQVCSET